MAFHLKLIPPTTTPFLWDPITEPERAALYNPRDHSSWIADSFLIIGVGLGFIGCSFVGAMIAICFVVPQ